MGATVKAVLLPIVWYKSAVRFGITDIGRMDQFELFWTSICRLFSAGE